MNKRLFTLAALALVLSASSVTTALAQTPDSERRFDRRIEFLDQKLDLTDSQIEQLKELHAVRSEAAEAQRAEARAEFEALLTAEQREKLSELPARAMIGGSATRPAMRRSALQRNNRRIARSRAVKVRNARSRSLQRGIRSNRRAAMRPGLRSQDNVRSGRQMAQFLDLSDEQQESLKNFRESQQLKAATWLEANPEATREEHQAFRTEQKNARQAQLENVLTDEQQEKLKELEERRESRMKTRPQGRRGQFR
ncbi:MAG: hypothetical protein HKN13_01385, partial [Rhodothermales bacterium]|nr:hypothetical protein [Rhodothermales bacterium]